MNLSKLSVTTQLIIFTSIISIIALIIMGFFPGFISFVALQPSSILQGQALWTLVSHIFIHASLIHLFVNMFVLFSLGNLTERIIGGKRLLWFYVISGIFAGLLSVVMSGLFGYGLGAQIFGSPDVYMVGASGAIFAIAGLFVVILPKLRFSIIFLPFFSLPAYIMVPVVLILTWIVSSATNLGIGNVAHLGGFLSGIVYGFYLRNKYRKKIDMIQRVFR